METRGGMEAPSGSGLESAYLECPHPAPTTQKTEDGPLVCSEGQGSENRSQPPSSAPTHPPF